MQDGEQKPSVILGWGGEVASKVNHINRGSLRWTLRLPERPADAAPGAEGSPSERASADRSGRPLAGRARARPAEGEAGGPVAAPGDAVPTMRRPRDPWPDVQGRGTQAEGLER